LVGDIDTALDSINGEVVSWVLLIN
jgi:hypothetical protein